jgi:hypothetical protein
VSCADCKWAQLRNRSVGIVAPAAGLSVCRALTGKYRQRGDAIERLLQQL